MLLLLELNEVNFDYLEKYIDRGLLPNFAGFLSKHGFACTTSEAEYEHLEPWIQWVTAHTGKPLSEHKVFRLGDIVEHDLPQIWEALAERGLRVGAISPMNAKCRRPAARFFVPDPWTRTEVIGDGVTRRLYRAIAQAVNDNAQARLTPRSTIDLALGALLKSRPANWARYAGYLMRAVRKPWLKAVILDQLLADLFLRETKAHDIQFGSLFLNAAAHIQHHYMFSSAAYGGTMRNPDWYVRPGDDPLLDVYQAYDDILGDTLLLFPDARLMIATGLHQDPHPDITYYWRLNRHEDFLRKIGVEGASVRPLMSRDFVASFQSEAGAATAQAVLAGAVAGDGQSLFEIENRGKNLFVMLTYPAEITNETRFSAGGRTFTNLLENVSFVAIKNGRHNGIGYFSDSGQASKGGTAFFPLSEIPDRILQATITAHAA